MLDRRHIADERAGTVEIGAAAALRISQFPVNRRIRHAKPHHAAALQGDLRREHGVFAHEGLGAVDWIHEPDVLRVGRMGTRLLTVEARTWETRACKSSRIASSHWTSASVTGDLSALRRTPILRRYRGLRDVSGALRGVERGLQFG